MMNKLASVKRILGRIDSIGEQKLGRTASRVNKF